jgi:hypothetical protein
MAFSLNTQWNKDVSVFERDEFSSITMDNGLTRRKTAIEKYFGFDNKGKHAFRGSHGAAASIFGLTILPRSDVFSYDGGRLKIPFQYLTEGVPSLTKTANYDDTNIPGRFEGIPSFTYANTTEFQLDLTYIAESKQRTNIDTGAKSYLENSAAVANGSLGLEQAATNYYNDVYGNKNKGATWTLEYINKLIPLYESLVYPQYDEGFNPPNLCLLNIGAIFMDLPVLIKTVTIAHKQPFDIQTMMPRTFQVTLDLRIAYSLYQAISSRAIIDKSVDVLPRSVYMRKTISKTRFSSI